MAQLNEFMTRIDLSVLNDYVAANGKSVVYAKGERIVQQGRLCRYVGVVKSGYFKYVALNSKGQEVVTGFSFEGEVVTDYVQGFLYDRLRSPPLSQDVMPRFNECRSKMRDGLS